jgi:uncharacterized DUF497 family protein
MRRFEWHEAKALSNLRKHGVSFETAAQAFDDPFSILDISGYVDGEERLRLTGATYDWVLLIVIHLTWYEGDVEVVRIISARTADPHERRTYEEG